MVQVEAPPSLSEPRNSRQERWLRWAFLWVGEGRSLPQEGRLGECAEILDSRAAPSQNIQVLADSMMAFTPHISLAEDGIWLEIGKTAHLFGGEESILYKMLAKAQSLGFHGCVVVADQPQTSRVLSRTLAGSDLSHDATPFLVPRGGDARALSSLPVSMLGPSDAATRLLEQLGVIEIGALSQISASSLRCRIGLEGEWLVQCARAERGELPPRYLPADRPRVELEFEPPLWGYEPLQFVFKRLLDDLVVIVEGRGMAIDAFCMEIDLAGGSSERVELPLARPSRSAESLLRVTREYLCRTEVDDSGILRVGFQILRMAEHIEEQGALFERGAQVSARGAELLTRLEASLGAGAVYGAALRSTWRPEESWGSAPFDPGESPVASSKDRAVEEDRPIFLFAEPHELHGELEPGETLRWPQGCGTIATIWGPERLQASWWSQPLVRDYYVVELMDGARLWVYGDLEKNRLYLHGLFD